MDNLIKISIKIILIVLFGLCLLDMPYSYFQLVRIAGLAGFAWLAYNEGSKADKSSEPVADGPSLQSCATNEAANSTLLSPLRAQYHKYAPATTRPPTKVNDQVPPMKPQVTARLSRAEGRSSGVALSVKHLTG